MKAYPQSVCDRLKRLSEVHGVKEAARIVGVSDCMVYALRKRGWAAGDNSKLPDMPADFPFMINRMTVHQLSRHYSMSLSTVRKFMKGMRRFYEPRSSAHEPIQAPPKAEIVKAIKEMGVTAAARHFGVCDRVLRRWRVEYGLPIAAPKVKPKQGDYHGWVERYYQERRAA